MRKWKLRAVAGTGLAVAMMLAASYGASAAVSVDTNRPSRTITGTGSDNTYEVMNDLDQLYNQSPGCAVIPVPGTAFANYQQKCLDPGSLTYSTDYANLIGTENLYHDRALENFPTGSTNGRLTVQQYVQGNPAIVSDFGRASSKQTYAAIAGFTNYGVAYARGGVGYWVGKNNSSVVQASGVPNPNLTIADLKLIFVGNASGQCGINWSSNANDSLGATLGAPGAGNITVFSTQAGSGTGLGFLRLIDPGVTYSDATALQNCIPASKKDGLGGDDHVIFENNANPICNVNGTSFRSSAIYPYEFARFVQNNGSAGSCAGAMGRVEGVKPTTSSIGKLPGTTGAFPLGSYRYNYFYVPNGQDVNDPTTWSGQTQAVLDYLHPVTGWLCQATHAVDPISGTNYRTLIANQLKADGFAPLKLGAVGGSTFTGQSYCRDASAT